MIKPRTINEKSTGEDRTTIRFPKAETGFTGWGPRLRY
jgi:hypothetical protein